MHSEALTEKAKSLVSCLAEFKDFYLAGGTALALQLGHRVSVDFDLFSENKIREDFIREVEKKFYGKRLEISVSNADELTILADSVKVTFLYYPFRLLYSLTTFQNIKLTFVNDIASMKAYTIGRRGSFKDYVDLYFILKDGFSLEQIITDAEKKYESAFNARLFMEQLVYLKDLEDTKIIFLREKIEIADLQQFFEQEIKKIKF